MAETSNNNGGSYTTEAWVMMKTPIDNGPVSILLIGDSSGSGMEVKTENGAYQLYAYYGSLEPISTVIQISQPDSWHHFAVAADASTVVIYLDGEPVETTPNSQGEVPDISSNINMNGDFLTEIAEVRIWKMARSEQDIRTDLYHSLTGSELGLKVYLPLNGAPEVSPFSATCLNLSRGDSAYIQALKLDKISLPRITVEFWVNAKEEGMQGALFDYADNAFNAFSISNAQHLKFTVCGDNVESMPPLDMTDGDWHHLAVTWHALTGEFIVYQNGLEKFTCILAPGKQIPGYGTLTLGTPQFAGQLCEVRIWNAVRSQEEIYQDIFFRLVGDEPDLRAYWQLNGDTTNLASWQKNNSTVPTETNFMLRRKNKNWQDAEIDNELAYEVGMWTDSGLFLKQAPVIQSKDMRDQWAALLKQSEIGKTEQGEGPGKAFSVTVENLIQEINQEISSAKENSQDELYSLSDVQMSIKTVPASDGSSLIFPTVEQLEKMDSDQISTINLNFVPDFTPDANAGQQTVPNVLNYSEAMAKHKLDAADFYVKVNSQTVTEENKVGYVVNQYPEADSQVPALSEVIIFVGKKLETANA